MNKDYTRGVLFVHSCPRALSSHVEWAVGAVLDQRVNLEWVGQIGTGAKLASALRGWEHLRFEVTEDASINNNGGRWSYTPNLGIFHAQTDVVGNVVVPEDRVRSALAQGSQEDLRRLLDLALGTAWDEELEPFRYAGAGAPVRWLHRVG